MTKRANNNAESALDRNIKESKNNKNKVTLLGCDLVESPNDIIKNDRNPERKVAFKEAYIKVMKIIPEYFLTQKRRKNSGGSSGGKTFTQNIIVTEKNATLETTNNKLNKTNIERERDE